MGRRTGTQSDTKRTTYLSSGNAHTQMIDSYILHLTGFVNLLSKTENVTYLSGMYTFKGMKRRRIAGNKVSTNRR